MLTRGKSKAIQILAAAGLLTFAVGQRGVPGADEISFSRGPFRPDIRFISQATEVQVAAVVRDHDGKPVDDLTQQDFAIRDNRKPQIISSFTIDRREGDRQAGETVAPAGLPAQGVAPAGGGPRPQARYIVFFVDDMFSKFGDIVHARNAIHDVTAGELGQAPTGGNHFAIATESGYGTLPFTQDAAAISDALNKIAPHPRVSPATCPVMNPFEAYLIANGLNSQLLQLEVTEATADGCCPQQPQTTIRGRGRGGGGGGQPTCYGMVSSVAQSLWKAYEAESRNAMASLRQAVEYAGEQHSEPGAERIVLLASAGFLSTTIQDDVEAVSTEALRAGVTINTLDAEGIAVPGDFAEDHPATESNPMRKPLWSEEQFQKFGAMQQLADDTGGTFFQGSNDLHAGVRELLEPPQVEYLLGFSPTDLKEDGSRHSLSVEVVREGSFSVQARQGYTAPAPDERVHTKPVVLEALRKLVLSDQDTSGLQAALTVDTASGLRSTLRVNPRTLPLRHSAQRERDELTAVAVLLDAKGNFVTGTQVVASLNLQDRTLAKFMQPNDGVEFYLGLPAKSGEYRLRVAVAEANKGMMASFTRTLTVPKGE